ncbi:oligosaccharide flippase family protein [Microbacterium sp. LRZ72]|uniref:lipopolysaccharide biosynthesis protein n=1 Tax=Microbacterium sp. LRZ72 TaxID=2942481 RepID=UPI0029A61983|nr:oligosaccharide flippase family protein [Microbacterium sp. LRZ72]MDX2377985.1 oligosaccharide flippase family protein [Microbacterium sp. LRZ72]
MGNDSGQGRAPAARPALALVASQVIGQLALAAVIPVLTRAYPPAELGVYQIAFAIAFIVLPVATLRLEYVVPTTHSPALVTRRLRLGLGTATALGAAALLGGLIAGATGAGDAAGILVMSGLLIPALGLPLLDGARLIRRGARRALAVRNLVGGVAGASLQAVFALTGGDVLLLPVALLVGRLIGILASRFVTDAAAPGPAADAEERDERYTLARAAPTIGAGVLAGATIQGLTVIAGATLGTGAAGQAGVAQRIASAPIALAGQALTQTTQLEFSRIIRDRRPELARSLAAHVRVFLLAGAAVGLALAVGGPLLAGPVLGEQWAPAGILIAMLALPAALQVAVSPTDFLFVMLRRERMLLALQGARAGLTWSAGLIAAALTGDLAVITLCFSVAWAASYAGSLIFVTRAARRFDRQHAPAGAAGRMPAATRSR